MGNNRTAGGLLSSAEGATVIELLVLIGAVVLSSYVAVVSFGGALGDETADIGAEVRRIHRPGAGTGAPAAGIPVGMLGAAASPGMVAAKGAQTVHYSLSNIANPKTEFGRIVSKSKDLVEALDRLKQEGWGLQFVAMSDGMFASANASTKTIYFTNRPVPTQALASVAHYLGHEVAHAETEEHHRVSRPQLMESEAEYVERGLREMFQHEGEAELVAWEYDKQMVEGGAPDPRERSTTPELRAAYARIYAAYQADGDREAAGKAFGEVYRQTASEFDRSYEEGYARRLSGFYAESSAGSIEEGS